MSEPISADDLALLAASFEAAMAEAPGPGEADHALYELGWGEFLESAPIQGAAIAFRALGTTGSSAGLLDDVVTHALGLPTSPDTCVVFPPSPRSTPPARPQGDRIEINGLVSSRIDRATNALLAVDEVPGLKLARVDAGLLQWPVPAGVDPDHPYRRLRIQLPVDSLIPVEAEVDWDAAVAAARAALANQLVGGARWMMAEAGQHAIDRVQFGRPVASFQAIRHKLAESLVLIEGAASVASSYLDDPSPLLAALAKSLAGQAALTTAAHAQQVLAGISFTAEHRFHLWLKRMLVVDSLLGSANTLPTEIGHDLMSKGAVPRLISL